MGHTKKKEANNIDTSRRIDLFSSAENVKKKGSVAFSLSTFRNMMCCVTFLGT